MTPALPASWLAAFVAGFALVPCDQRPRGPEGAATAEIECNRDEDCTLLPVITCCGECPPEPPFEAVTIPELDGVLIELEERCATERRSCAPPVCAPAPRRCEARAACAGGECVVLRGRCERPLS